MASDEHVPPGVSPGTPASPAAGERPALGRAPRALLVDDEAVIRHALRRFLQRQGWEVDEAAEGGEALRRLLGDGEPAPDGSRAEYALVICDLQMPGVSGVELHARLAAERPALLAHVVFTTGDTGSPGALAVRAAGSELLAKPFDLADLRAILERRRAAG